MADKNLNDYFVELYRVTLLEFLKSMLDIIYSGWKRTSEFVTTSLANEKMARQKETAERKAHREKKLAETAAKRKAKQEAFKAYQEKKAADREAKAAAALAKRKALEAQKAKNIEDAKAAFAAKLAEADAQEKAQQAAAAAAQEKQENRNWLTKLVNNAAQTLGGALAAAMLATASTASATPNASPTEPKNQSQAASQDGGPATAAYPANAAVNDAAGKAPTISLEKPKVSLKKPTTAPAATATPETADDFATQAYHADMDVSSLREGLAAKEPAKTQAVSLEKPTAATATPRKEPDLASRLGTAKMANTTVAFQDGATTTPVPEGNWLNGHKLEDYQKLQDTINSVSATPTPTTEPGKQTSPNGQKYTLRLT